MQETRLSNDVNMAEL